LGRAVDWGGLTAGFRAQRLYIRAYITLQVGSTVPAAYRLVGTRCSACRSVCVQKRSPLQSHWSFVSSVYLYASMADWPW